MLMKKVWNTVTLTNSNVRRFWRYEGRWLLLEGVLFPQGTKLELGFPEKALRRGDEVFSIPVLTFTREDLEEGGIYTCTPHWPAFVLAREVSESIFAAAASRLSKK
jgi:hypothetical protein